MTLLFAHFGVGLLIALIRWFFDDDMEVFDALVCLALGFLSLLVFIFFVITFIVWGGWCTVTESHIYKRSSEDIRERYNRIYEAKIKIRQIMRDAIFGKDKTSED